MKRWVTKPAFFITEMEYCSLIDFLCLRWFELKTGFCFFVQKKFLVFLQPSNGEIKFGEVAQVVRASDS